VRELGDVEDGGLDGEVARGQRRSAVGGHAGRLFCVWGGLVGGLCAYI
jgi:hypothetical protein